jgi:choline dehydrogenase-like flavoprotein
MPNIDLQKLPDKKTIKSYDVCIVGAGAAGLYLARRLVMQGNHVALLEAGSDICVMGKDIGIEATHEEQTYEAAINGRAFGIGGTTSLWGGQLLPYSSYDKRGNSETWLNIVDTVERYTKIVYNELGIAGDIDHLTLGQGYLGDGLIPLTSSDIAVSVSDWLPFRRRNLRFLTDDLHKSSGQLNIYTNAVASTWSLVKQSNALIRIESVTARSTNGRELQIHAKQFLIASGAIESARILLEIFLQSGRGTSKHSVGHYLSDHLSSPVAKVQAVDSRKIELMFGPRFKNGRMRTFRFIDKGNNGDRPKGFFHFVFMQENPGFHLARKILGGLQSRRVPDLNVSELLGGVHGISMLAYARFMKNRLFIPANTPIQLQLDFEQKPQYDNYIALTEEKDVYNRLKAKIHWRVSSEDYEYLEYASSKFLSNWPSRELKMSSLSLFNSIELNKKLYDTYHPVGTCRMGTKDSAVVDSNLQVYGMDNVYVASTGVFPSAGTANPTFSLLCLAEGLANHIGKIQ